MFCHHGQGNEVASGSREGDISFRTCSKREMAVSQGEGLDFVRWEDKSTNFGSERKWTPIPTE